jgi:homoserine kinase type II
MATNSQFGKREAAQIASEYGLPKLSSVRPVQEFTDEDQRLLETNRGKFVVRFQAPKSEIELKREIDLLSFLRKHGIPTSVPLSDSKGRYCSEWGERQLAVYKFVEGHRVAVEDLTPGQLENIGRLMGDLHVLGKAYKKGVDNRFGFERVAEIYAGVRGRLPQYLKKITRTLDEEVEYLRNYLETKLPKGIIHGDLVAENLRFKGDKVTEVFGFESAARGKFIFDLAAAVNALCFENGGYSLKRFEALITGYEALRTLSLAEWDAFPNELRFSAFRFTVARLRDFFETPGDERLRINKDFQDSYERLGILRREREGGMEAMLMAMATGYDYRKYQKVKAGERRSH